MRRARPSSGTGTVAGVGNRAFLRDRIELVLVDGFCRICRDLGVPRQTQEEAAAVDGNDLEGAIHLQQDLLDRVGRDAEFLGEFAQ